jgi:alpha-ribazole phosphatase
MENFERTRVYLIRHGQVKGYENFPVYGHTDVELTETGVLQLQQMSERLRLVDLKAIYSSDLNRTIQGAREIARHHDVPLYSLPGIKESYFGDWEGLTMETIRTDYPEELEKRQADLFLYEMPGGGESLADFSKRITECYNRILTDQKGRDIAIIAHGGVNRVILSSALGLDLSQMFRLHQDYGCLNIIDYFPDSTLVRLVNG